MARRLLGKEPPVHISRKGTACLTLALWLSQAAASAEHAGNAGKAPLRGLLKRRATWGALQRVGQRALRLLDSAECRRVFSDFTDERGSTLQANLEALGQTPAGYLHLILFVDGGQLARCRKDPVLAVTTVGSRVVHLCPEAFEKAVQTNGRHAEAILIHEALHSLGLGENPPSSHQITDRVLARCR